MSSSESHNIKKELSLDMEREELITIFDQLEIIEKDFQYFLTALILLLKNYEREKEIGKADKLVNKTQQEVNGVKFSDPEIESKKLKLQKYLNIKKERYSKDYFISNHILSIPCIIGENETKRVIEQASDELFSKGYKQFYIEDKAFGPMTTLFHYNDNGTKKNIILYNNYCDEDEDEKWGKMEEVKKNFFEIKLYYNLKK